MVVPEKQATLLILMKFRPMKPFVKNRITLLTRATIWYRAVFLDYPYWRVTYADGRRVTFLPYSEAKRLPHVFNCKLSIDYYCVSQKLN